MIFYTGHIVIFSLTGENVFEEQDQQDRGERETKTSSTCTSAGSFKFYREFNGTTSAKLSRTSKAGRQGILVTPRVIMHF